MPDVEINDIRAFTSVDCCVNVNGKKDEKKKCFIEGIKEYNIAELENAEPLTIAKTEDEEMLEN